MPIRQLPDTLINQIAAGEVVERPASVVKELVENALDAGALRIDIELEEGGARLIRIRDNGSGIPAAELPLAISRHATSKIASLDDLEAVATLGFRGEALPSIASVSRFSLSSRHQQAEHGATLQVDAGKVGTVTPAAHPVGTTVEVRELFHNVPARRKFLRAERTEFAHIEEWLRSLALSRPDIELRVGHNGKPARRYKANEGQFNARVQDALGEEFAQHALHVDHQAAGLRLHGWLALPSYTRASAQQQYLYVNGRAVRDRNMAHAVKAGYQDLMFHGRYPACVLFLEIDPRRVDVNVHPAKHEVRFRDARLVHDFIQRTLHEALTETRTQSDQAWQQPGAEAAFVHVSSAPWQAQASSRGRIAEHRQAYSELYSPATTASESSPEAPVAGIPLLGYAIAQLHGIYILAENAHGLIVVDTRPAQARVLADKLRRGLGSGALHGEPLLLPQDVLLGATQAEGLQAHSSLLECWGLQWSMAGAGKLSVRAMPALLLDLDPGSLLETLLQHASMRAAGSSTQTDEDALVDTLAWQALSRNPRRLGIVEMNALLRRMENMGLTTVDGNGRELAVQWSLDEIEQWFSGGPQC